MMDNSAVESLIAGTSRSQSLEYQGRDFIPGDVDQMDASRRFLDATSNDPDVIASKAPTTQGLYGSDVEKSFDVDIVSKRNMLPVDALDEIAKQAVDDAQDSFFIARRIEPELAKENPEAFQVGMEAYFNEPVSPDGDTIKELQKHLNSEGIQGFTMIVDPRKKPGAMANEVIGVRFLDIPQFYDAEKFANMSPQDYAKHVDVTRSEYERIGNDLKDIFGEIRTAEPSFFDVNVKSQGEAANYVAQLQSVPGDTGAIRDSFWGFKPATTRFKEWHGGGSASHSQAGATASQSGFVIPTGLVLGATATAATLAPQEAEAGPVKVLSHLDEAGNAVYKTVIDAWHGSPHKFDKFSMDNIGTGEGAQAYGHGLYFADSEGVARSYKSMQGGKAFTTWRTNNPDAWADYRSSLFETYPDVSVADVDILDEIQRTQQGLKPNYPVSETVTKELKDAESLEIGSLYRTELDVDPDTLLDWDKPLSEQSESVRAGVEDIYRSTFDDPDAVAVMDFDGSVIDMKSDYSPEEWAAAERLYKKRGNRISTVSEIERQKFGGGMGFHGHLAEKLGGQDKLSSRLNEQGIPGIRYLDGDSRSAGTGSSNYVMFDDSKISIKERGNATPGMLGAVAAGSGAVAALGMGSEEAEASMVAPQYQDRIDNYYNPEGTEYRMADEMNSLLQHPDIRNALIDPPEISAPDMSMSPYEASAEQLRNLAEPVIDAAGDATNFAFEALEIPSRGLHGLSAAIGALATGSSFDDAVSHGSNVSQQSIDEIADQLGKFVADKTGSPYAAALTHAITQTSTLGL